MSAGRRRARVGLAGFGTVGRAVARPFVIALEPAWSGAVESALCEIARFDFHVHLVLAMPMLAPAASMAVSA